MFAISLDLGLAREGHDVAHAMNLIYWELNKKCLAKRGSFDFQVPSAGMKQLPASQWTRRHELFVCFLEVKLL